MAKKPTIGDNPFRKTEQAQPGQPAEKPPTPRGVALEAEEIAELESIAGQMNTSVHKILQYAVRDFLKRWRAGEIQPETETVTRLKMPGD
jgi:hypothetical protein